MGMTRYRKGYEKERRLVNEARAQGCIAFRSAGSHSPIDVCIIDSKAHRITFIQAKTNISKKAKQRLEMEFIELTDMYDVEFVVR